MSRPAKQIYEFGPFRIDAAERLLLRGGDVVPLTPKVFDTLLVLVENSGHILEKEELMKAVWPDAVVEEANLTRNISTLRKALGETPDQHQYIETIPWRGYRFVGRVSARADQAKGMSKEAAPTGGQPHVLRRSRIRALFWLLPIPLLGVGAAIWLYLLKPAPPLPPMRIVPLTSFPNPETEPAFSPDGDRIAFAYTGESGRNLDIYVKLIGTGTPLALTNTPAGEASPAWSPDGRHVAFIRVAPGEGERGIFRVPALGGPPEEKLHPLTSGILHLGLEYSPDGNLLAFADRAADQESHSIFLLSLSSLERRRLTFPPEGPFTGDCRPAFSPDGKKLAFVRKTSYGNDIYLVATAGGEPARLTFDHAAVEGLAWTSDGEGLVFSSNRLGTQSLWRIPASGGSPQRLEVGAENCLYPAISRRGGRLAYMQSLDDANIWRAELPRGRGKPTQATKLIGSTLFDGNPQYSADGSRVAFESNRSGSQEIWVCKADGTRPVQVTALEKADTGHPRWSPDGSRIAFCSRAEGHRDIFVVNVAGGVPRRLTTEDSSDEWPSWSKDGRWVYFASNRSGAWEVWKVPADGGGATQVTRTGGFVALESPDGKTLYFSKFDRPGLFSMPAQGGGEVLITEELLLGDWGRWYPGRAGFYFLTRDEREALSIAFFNFATRTTTRVVPLEDRPYRVGLAVSPDERWVLYPQVDYRSRNIWVVESFR